MNVLQNIFLFIQKHFVQLFSSLVFLFYESKIAVCTLWCESFPWAEGPFLWVGTLWSTSSSLTAVSYSRVDLEGIYLPSALLSPVFIIPKWPKPSYVYCLPPRGREKESFLKVTLCMRVLGFFNVLAFDTLSPRKGHIDFLDSLK